MWYGYEEEKGNLFPVLTTMQGVQKSKISPWFNQADGNDLPPTVSHTGKSNIRSEGKQSCTVTGL